MTAGDFMFGLRFLIFAAVFAVSSALHGAEGGEVIWWLVEDLDKITAKTVSGETVSAADPDLNINAARIRYDNGTDSGYLPIYAVDIDNKVHLATGTGGAALLPGEYFTALGGMTGPSYSFVIELGNWSNGNWLGTAMESASSSYDDLKSKNHIASWQDTLPAYSTPWTPDSYSVVPEPSSGLMVLIGVSALLLRRRTRREK
jgi:hypothetical protein